MSFVYLVRDSKARMCGTRPEWHETFSRFDLSSVGVAESVETPPTWLKSGQAWEAVTGEGGPDVMSWQGYQWRLLEHNYYSEHPSAHPHLDKEAIEVLNFGLAVAERHIRDGTDDIEMAMFAERAKKIVRQMEDK